MKKNKGLTLVELIVSVALISIVIVFLFQLLIELRYQNLNDTSKVEYKVAASLITKKIQSVLMEEEVDLITTCDETNTCLKITFVSDNYLEIKIQSDNKVLNIIKKDSDDNIIMEDTRQIPEKDETGYLGEFNGLGYTTTFLDPNNASYDYRYDSLLKLEFNMTDSLNNEYPIVIYYPYVGGTDFSSLYLNNVRYIKDCVNGSTSSTNNHWVELQALYNGTNVAYGKTVTGTVAYNTSFKPYSAVTDGDINSANYSQAAVSGELQCITVDLAQTYNLDEITVWHYYTDNRIYYSNTMYVSSDNTTWHPVMANLNSESASGKRIIESSLTKTIKPIYRVSNLVINGSFENGATGWYFYSGISAVANSSKYGSYLLHNYHSVQYGHADQAISVTVGHTYYASVWMYTHSVGSGLCYNDLSIYYDSTHHWQGFGGSQSNIQVWQKKSQIYTIPSVTSPSIYPAILPYYGTDALEDCYADGVFMIDLTAAFGAGKEPSKAWCDANLNYFDGSQNLYLNP